MIWYPRATAVLSFGDMKSIYASNDPGSGMLNRSSLCVGVPAWEGDDEIGDRSGHELVSSDSYYYELVPQSSSTSDSESRYQLPRGGKPSLLSKICSNLARG